MLLIVNALVFSSFMIRSYESSEYVDNYPQQLPSMFKTSDQMTDEKSFREQRFGAKYVP